jgi:predicted ATP-binding protein involved in virulence
MYLKQIHLKNITCFGETTLDFFVEDNPCKWIVLLGENGTGKSTLLQMIAISLLGRDFAQENVRSYDWKRFLGKSSTKGRVVALLSTKTSDSKRNKQSNKEVQSLYQTALEFNETVRTGLEQDLKSNGFKEDFKVLNQTLYSEFLTGGWFACGYGTWRGALQQTTSTREVSAKFSRKSSRFATMFDEGSALSSVNDWLVQLDYRRLKEQDDDSAGKSFDLAIKTLERVLNGIKFEKITSDSKALFNDNGNLVTFDQLSEGYRSTLTWVGDLIRRLIDAFPRLKNPLLAQGIVLIDEIDIHLHPKWQMNIVEQIRELFPNLQFIVSSHSPFVVQDMQHDDKIIVLEKNDGVVTTSDEIGFVQNWRVDQILTSDLFKLATTRNIADKNKQAEYKRLLDLQGRNELGAEDKKRLYQIKKWLDDNQSLPTENIEDEELYKNTSELIDIFKKRIGIK